MRRKWNVFNEWEGRRHNPTPPPSTSASKTCTNTFCAVILETWWTVVHKSRWRRRATSTCPPRLPSFPPPLERTAALRTTGVDNDRGVSQQQTPPPGVFGQHCRPDGRISSYISITSMPRNASVVAFEGKCSSSATIDQNTLILMYGLFFCFCFFKNKNNAGS